MFALTQITKQQVDSFSPGQTIPSCILTAEWTKESKPSVLLYTMALSGAKESSYNWFRIILDTDSTQPGIPRGGLTHVYRVSNFVAGLRKLAGRSNRN